VIRKRKQIVNLPSQPKDFNSLPLGDNLKYIEKKTISSLISLNNYRGFRHSKGLPVRGQRTHTNAQTQKYLSRTRITNTKERKMKKGVQNRPRLKKKR